MCIGWFGRVKIARWGGTEARRAADSTHSSLGECSSHGAALVKTPSNQNNAMHTDLAFKKCHSTSHLIAPRGASFAATVQFKLHREVKSRPSGEPARTHFRDTCTIMTSGQKVAVCHRTVSVKKTHAANVHHNYATQSVLARSYLEKDRSQTSSSGKQEGATDTLTHIHPHSHYQYMLFCKQ